MENRKNYKSKNKVVSNFEQRTYPLEFWESLYDNCSSNESSEDDMDLDM